MVRPSFIQELYVDSHDAIKRDTATMSHRTSLWQPPFGGNCVNWLMGHLIVSRCNFLMLLDVPSVWSMEQCRRFMPGSEPVTGESGSVSFAMLLADFDRTQDRLLELLTRTTAEDLSVIKGKRSVAETLLYYQAHEANHAGQIELLSQFSGQETGG
ncbi:MAG: DinB family protein [Chloroflexota bacterium]|nr:MAG: DinB family protein [Chloroflexota bacterium]